MAVLWIASLVDFAVAAWLWLGAREAPAFVAPLLVLAGAFQLHALYSVAYTLDASDLRIRASFFRWRVPLADIESIEPTRNPLSSPACSLDRLLIRYGGQAHHDLARRQGRPSSAPSTNAPPMSTELDRRCRLPLDADVCSTRS